MQTADPRVVIDASCRYLESCNIPITMKRKCQSSSNTTSSISDEDKQKGSNSMQVSEGMKHHFTLCLKDNKHFPLVPCKTFSLSPLNLSIISCSLSAAIVLCSLWQNQLC